MTIREAMGILKEMNLWRRAEGPYSESNPDTFRGMPYSPEEFGIAIDTAVEAMDMLINGDFDRINNQ